MHISWLTQHKYLLMFLRIAGHTYFLVTRVHEGDEKPPACSTSKTMGSRIAVL